MASSNLPRRIIKVLRALPISLAFHFLPSAVRPPSRSLCEFTSSSFSRETVLFTTCLLSSLARSLPPSSERARPLRSAALPSMSQFGWTGRLARFCSASALAECRVRVCLGFSAWSVRGSRLCCGSIPNSVVSFFFCAGFACASIESSANVIFFSLSSLSLSVFWHRSVVAAEQETQRLLSEPGKLLLIRQTASSFRRPVLRPVVSSVLESEKGCLVLWSILFWRF